MICKPINDNDTEHGVSAVEIRDATVDDAALVLKMVKELAASEHAAGAVRATETDIRESLFGEHSTAGAAICSVDGVDAGFAVYFFNFTTRQGVRGLCLEDLYVSPPYRDTGAGEALLKHLAKIAVARGCSRMMWSVQDWNERTTQFYRSIGMKLLNALLGRQLSGRALEEFSASA